MPPANSLPPHLHGDADGLTRALRQAERQHQDGLVVLACEALATMQVWGPIDRAARGLLARAMPDQRSLQPGCTPAPWTPTELHQLTGYAPLARHAYNCARLLAPISGELHAPEPGADPEQVPNPLRWCVRALRIWWPGGWKGLLRQVIDCDSYWRTGAGGLALEFGGLPQSSTPRRPARDEASAMLRQLRAPLAEATATLRGATDDADDVSTPETERDPDDAAVRPDHHVIHENGEMMCGQRAPVLAWLPECVCLVNGGRRGVCPSCGGKPARQGEMCVCVAGRCPRCGTAPKFSRENKAFVFSAYKVGPDE